MKKILFNKTLAYILTSLAILTACEKEVEFQSPDVGTISDLTLNAIAVEGEPFKVYLNKAYPVGKAPLLDIGSHFALLTDEFVTDYLTDEYYRKTAVLDAEVKAVVNGQQTYILTLATDGLGYECDYCPQAGDRIEVQAEGLYVETTVPARPMIEIQGHEILTENPYRLVNGMEYDTDTVMRITCHIPTTSSRQYYRLRVRGEKKMFFDWGPMAYYKMQDIYFSDDELFVDNRLSTGFGGWSPHFSDVFDSSMLSVNGHTFTVDSPKPSPKWLPEPNASFSYEVMKQQMLEPDVPARVMVELQSISPEYYRYLKSVELFRITESDAFSEPVQIYSNVQNGWGILGALSYDRHFVEYGE